MKRDVMRQLEAWKNRSVRKPLIVRGARQVGKTYCLKQFMTRFKSAVYVNFEEDKRLAGLFEVQLSPDRLIADLSVLIGESIHVGETLVIFDEIRESSQALNSLKYFNEKLPDLHLVAAGSLLGVRMGQTSGFPVGQVEFLDMYPMTFFEFLSALGKDTLRDRLESASVEDGISDPMHNECLRLCKTYIIVGGMPEVVSQYVASFDLGSVRGIQRAILSGYASDFAKYATPVDAVKISEVWQSIPAQLAKENKKFMFNVVRDSARARTYESAVTWLVDAGLLYKLCHVDTPRLPLKAYQDRQVFKLYLLDVGLLGAASELSVDAVLDDGVLFSFFRGAIVENLVLQELVAGRTVMGYWTSSGKAELDFVIQRDTTVLPVEVKSGEQTKAKSLAVYVQKYAPAVSTRITWLNLIRDAYNLNCPLYLSGRLGEIVDSQMDS